MESEEQHSGPIPSPRELQPNILPSLLPPSFCLSLPERFLLQQMHPERSISRVLKYHHCPAQQPSVAPYYPRIEGKLLRAIHYCLNPLASATPESLPFLSLQTVPLPGISSLLFWRNTFPSILFYLTDWLGHPFVLMPSPSAPHSAEVTPGQDM